MEILKVKVPQNYTWVLLASIWTCDSQQEKSVFDLQQYNILYLISCFLCTCLYYIFCFLKESSWKQNLSTELESDASQHAVQRYFLMRIKIVGVQTKHSSFICLRLCWLQHETKQHDQTAAHSLWCCCWESASWNKQQLINCCHMWTNRDNLQQFITQQPLQLI